MLVLITPLDPRELFRSFPERFGLAELLKSSFLLGLYESGKLKPKKKKNCPTEENIGRTFKNIRRA